MDQDIYTQAHLAAREVLARIWLHSVQLEALSGIWCSFGAKAALKGATMELDAEDCLGYAELIIGGLLTEITSSEEDAAQSEEDCADSITILSECFDNTLTPLVARLQRGIESRRRDGGLDNRNPESSTTAIRQALAANGVVGNQVVSFAKRSLQERIADRKKRRKWLRTSEGRAYLRHKNYRAKHVHRIDHNRSRTAKMARKMYQAD